MRSTRASAAVNRLNARDPEHRYSMGITANGYFYLLRTGSEGAPERLCEDLSQEEFVERVNRTGPQKQAKISKNDAAFERQLSKRK